MPTHTYAGHPLIGRPDVICTPHLGASTTEAQEGVAIEVVEAVVDALAGKLSSNAVNAPMVGRRGCVSAVCGVTWWWDARAGQVEQQGLQRANGGEGGGLCISRV